MKNLYLLILFLGATLQLDAKSISEQVRAGLTSATLVPSVASTGGAGGSHWVSSVSIVNPQNVSIVIRMYLLPANTDNRNYRSSERTVTIPAGGAVRISDPLRTLWGTTGLASIFLESDPSAGNPAAFAVDSRIFNVADPLATFGLSLVGTLEGISSQDRGYAADVESSAAYRTNIGLFNDSSEAAVVEVAVVKPDGNLLARKSYNILPFSLIQLPVSDITTTPFNHASVRVAPPSTLSGQLIGYVSVIDNATNDPAAFPIRPYRSQQQSATMVIVNMTRYRFNPGNQEAPLVLQAGRTYDLIFRAIEGTHGVSSIHQLSIAGNDSIEEGTDYVVRVSPTEAQRGSRFNFACTQFCGVGHGSMFGSILIE